MKYTKDILVKLIKKQYRNNHEMILKATDLADKNIKNLNDILSLLKNQKMSDTQLIKSLNLSKKEFDLAATIGMRAYILDSVGNGKNNLTYMLGTNSLKESIEQVLNENVGYWSSPKQIRDTAAGIADMPSGKLEKFFVDLSDAFMDKSDLELSRADAKSFSIELLKISKLARRVN